MARLQTLPNGLRYVFIPRSKQKRASIVVGFGIGASEEPFRYAGALHLMEHLLIGRSRQSAQYARDLDMIGAEMNGMTTSDCIMFHCDLPGRFARWGFDRLADLVLTPTFTAEDVLRERNVVLEEFRGDNDSVEDRLELIADRLFYQGNPLARPIIGREASLQRLDDATLRRLWHRLVNPHQMVVAVAGHFDRGVMSEKLHARFGPLVPPAQLFALRPETPLPRALHHVTARYEGLDQVNFCWSIRLPGYRTRQRLALMALANVIGGRFSSPIYLDLRKRGYCYTFDTSIWFYPEVGKLDITSATSRGNFFPMISAIANALERYRRNGIPRTEFELAQRALRYGTIKNFEDVGYAARFYTGQVLAHGHCVDERRFLAAIQRLERSDLNAAANRVLQPGHYTFAAIGPLTRGDRQKLRSFFPPS